MANRVIAVGITVLLALGAGWFFLSWQVMGTAAGDAVGEAFGVMFALLIVASTIGAVRDAAARRGHHQPRDQP
jgi:hypothetical protein